MASSHHPSAPPIQIVAPSTASPRPNPATSQSTVSASQQNTNQKESVELKAVAEDFPNLMKFTSTPAMLDLCITDSLMPSPRFMQKMSQDEDVSTPPSSIQFEDELLMQAGTPIPHAHEKLISNPNSAKKSELKAGDCSLKAGDCSLNSSLPSREPLVVLSGNNSTSSGIKLGAWSKPLIPSLHLSSEATHHADSQEIDRFSTLSMDWPDLSGKNSKKNNSSFSAQLVHSGKQMVRPHVPSKEVPNFIVNDQEYPWAARMKGKCNLHRVTNPSYMDDGTPLVSIPSHILLEGLENQKEYVVGQFYRCLVPSGGQTHAVVNRLWGRKGRIFTRKLGEFSFLFHIPDEQTRNWVIQRGLWHVDDCLMFVSPWSPSETISLTAISTIPVWLTLKNIPNQLYSFKGIDWIASGIGAPMISSKPWLDPTQMGEAKILVEVKLSKPFPQKVALKDKSGNITMVDVLYSWLPPKCPNCDQLGHKASRCLGLPITVLDATVSAAHQTSTETTLSTPPNLKAQPIRSENVLPSQENRVQACTPPSLNNDLLMKSTISEEVVNPSILSLAPSITESGLVVLQVSTEILVTETALPLEEPALALDASSSDARVAINSETIDTASRMVTTSNPFSVLVSPSVLDTCEVCVEDNEEIHEDLGTTSLEMKTSTNGIETLEEESGPKSRVGRPLKPSQKVQEQLISIGRGNRGRGGRGGRGLFS